MKIKITDIIIGERQRKDFGDIEELAESLTRLGQIHNIGVNESNQLIWGMRRYLAAKSLGWEEIEATKKEGLTIVDEQEIELEEDIRRKNRTWQEETIAVAKLFALKSRQARERGEAFGVREMEAYSNISKSIVAQYVFNVAPALLTEPKDEEVWSQPNFYKALDLLRNRQEKMTRSELEERHKKNAALIAQVQQSGKLPTAATKSQSFESLSPSSVQIQDITPPKIGMTLSLRDRALAYNNSHNHLSPPNTFLFYENKDGREFITGFWFVGGGNISDLYGSYQIEYLKRIETLFPDAVKVVHLFVGGLPPSEKYVRVGLPQEGQTSKPDIECDAHYLSSHLPFKADVIYADPPYSVEDSEHYSNSMVNRERVLEECALSLADSGMIVWIDQALPIFKNELLQFVGAIGYIRSTGNRFRIISLFRKAKKCPDTKSNTSPTPSTSPNQQEQLPQLPPI